MNRIINLMNNNEHSELVFGKKKERMVEHFTFVYDVEDVEFFQRFGKRFRWKCEEIVENTLQQNFKVVNVRTVNAGTVQDDSANLIELRGGKIEALELTVEYYKYDSERKCETYKLQHYVKDPHREVENQVDAINRVIDYCNSKNIEPILESVNIVFFNDYEYCFILFNGYNKG